MCGVPVPFIDIVMGGSPGELSGACDVGETKEGLENELRRR